MKSVEFLTFLAEKHRCHRHAPNLGGCPTSQEGLWAEELRP